MRVFRDGLLDKFSLIFRRLEEQGVTGVFRAKIAGFLYIFRGYFRLNQKNINVFFIKQIFNEKMAIILKNGVLEA